jgi:hypothetical protein
MIPLDMVGRGHAAHSPVVDFARGENHQFVLYRDMIFSGKTLQVFFILTEN